MASPLMRYFGAELRRAREEAGVTQRQLAEAVIYSESKVGAVERGEQLASPAFVERADAFLNTGGLFTRMRNELLTMELSPEWFRPWIDIEREATEIRWHEPLLVPGLLQIEEYARALIEDASPDQAESLVAARLERQRVLERAHVAVVIDESVLHRRVGSPEVMVKQLLHLSKVRATVQVLPAAAMTYLHLEGPFALATLDGGSVGYVDTPARGFVVDDREVVSRLWRRWEAVRAEALPQRLSQDLIVEVAETWTSKR